MLPSTPGVYKFLDKEGIVLYIGKAINLRSRVSSYFNGSLADRPRILQMLPFVQDVNVTQTDNEIEALILESALIKEVQPKYNSDLKDDKSYAWLYINHRAQYPTVRIVRTLNKNEFRDGLLFGPYPSGKAIKRVFNYIRKIYPFCTSKNPSKPCFYSRIGLCPGPDATHEEYMANIKGIVKFLKGNNKGHIQALERQMKEYSDAKEYEKAAELRDKIMDLKYLGSEIKFNYFNSEQDYINDKKSRTLSELSKIAQTLNIDSLNRIECYDISNIQGKLAFGSMVVSIGGTPDNSQYRVFRIKQLDTPNDPEMLREVLSRRLKHIGTDKDESLTAKPDLLLIDGGKTQLSVLRGVIPQDINVLGITKGRKYKRRGGKKMDEFWIYSEDDVVQIRINNPRILSLLRDEAHRFAILHHRKLRKFTQKKSLLDEVKGIGPVLKKKLISKYGSVKDIRKVSLEELIETLGNKTTAQSLYDKLRETNLE